MAVIESTLEFGDLTLDLEPGRWVAALKEPVEPVRARKALAHTDVQLEDDPRATTKPGGAVNRGGRLLWLRAPAAHPPTVGVLKALRPLWIAPLYRKPGTSGDDGLVAARPDRAFVKASRFPKAELLIDRIAQRLGWRVVAVPGNVIAPWRLFVRGANAAATATDFVQKVKLQGRRAVQAACLDYLPRTAPIASPTDPSDWLYRLDRQRNLAVINAPAGWSDYAGATKTVRVAIIDKGLDLDHADLKANLASKGDPPQYGQLISDSATGGGLVDPAWMHGTALAGIVAAVTDNDDPADDSTKTMAGLARNCAIVSLASDSGTAGDVIAGLGLVVAEEWPADVILLGLVSDDWLPAGAAPDDSPLGTAIGAAISAGKVVVAPAGNMLNNTYEPTAPVRPVFPACVTGVVAVGASSSPDATAVDQRKPSTGDSEDFTTETWASRYGAGLSVVAPGTALTTTDNAGPSGRNTGLGYDPAFGTDFVGDFGGTSAAAAQVAGLAALVLSRHDAHLSTIATAAARVAEVRRIIERGAVRINTAPPTYTYAEGADHPNGPWHEEVGHGRIDVHRSLDLADVFIRDNEDDHGTEPSSGHFWAYSDIAVRLIEEDYPTVAAAFAGWQTDVAHPQTGVADDRDSWIYVAVHNQGPATARNVRVRAALAACSTGFKYPYDWWHDSLDLLHLPGVPRADAWASVPSGHGNAGVWYTIAALDPGSVAYARFQIAGADALTARDSWGWGPHICCLAVATADNDYPFIDFDAPLARTDAYAGQQPQRNNIAQRNLSVVHPGSPWRAAFLAGSFGDPDTALELVVDSRGLPPGTRARLHVDAADRAFPALDAAARRRGAVADAVARGADPGALDGAADFGLVILDRTRVHAVIGDREGLLTLEPGSRLDLRRRAGHDVTVRGGRVVLESGRRIVELEPAESRLVVTHRPHEAVPLLLEIPVPPHLPADRRYHLPIIQRRADGTVVGGITLLLAP